MTHLLAVVRRDDKGNTKQRAMKLDEVIAFHRDLRRRLSSVGIRLVDCKYLDLYEDYRKLREGGGKMTYIAAVLAEKYGVCERQVYLIIARFEKDCTDISV